MFGFRVVPQGYAMVVERLGKFNRVLHSGVHFLIPFVERPRPIYYRVLKVDVDGTHRVVTKRTKLIDLREQVLDFPKQGVITRDNVTMEINAVLYYQIIDPVKAVYGVANLVDAMEKLVQTTLRDVVGRLTLDETLASRDQINAQLRQALEEATPSWGVRVVRVELQEISPPEDIRKRMELQMTAEREKRAAILKAEGQKQAATLQAEGEAAAQIRRAEAAKQARILEAEGAAQAKRELAQAEADALARLAAEVGREKAVEYLLALRYLEALRTIAEGKATKLFLPVEATGVLGALGGLGELLGSGTRDDGA